MRSAAIFVFLGPDGMLTREHAPAQLRLRHCATAPQFLSEFLIESVETLERIANETPPPLGPQAILKKIEDLAGTNDETKIKEIKDSLSEMDKIYVSGQGDLQKWKYELLDAIDDLFVKHFMSSGEPVEFLFSTNCFEYLNKYKKYRTEVGDLLVDPKYKAPKFAREYFLYSTIWEMRGFKFPVPLGTKSVFECLNKLASARRRGIEEVRDPFMKC